MAAIIAILLLISFSLSHAEITVWEHNYLEEMSTAATAPSDMDLLLSCRVTPGEYEPVSFAVRSDESVQLDISFNSSQDFSAIPRTWIELSEIGSLYATSKLNRLYELTGPLELTANQTRFFWVTIRPPSTAAAGTYTGKFQVVSESGVAAELTLQCDILPFHLARSPIIGGVFMAGIDLPASWYVDMKEHGLDAIQFFWFGSGAIVMKNQYGELVADYEVLDRVMTNLQAAGMQGPIIPSLGNDNILSYEIQIANAFGIPVDTSDVIAGKTIKGPAVSPVLDSLFVEGLRMIGQYWEEKKYPELVILIYDEPTERLLSRHKSRYDLLKTVLPQTRVYGVVMNRRSWAESMIDQCDIIVANGDFSGCLEVASQHNKDFWVYSAPLNAVSIARFKMGCMAWDAQASGVFFWMYNYWDYDPDGCAVYPHPDDPDRLIRSTYWEGVREGMDDLRYLATAESLMAQAGEEEKANAEQELDAIRSLVNPYSPLSVEELVYVREKLIEIILNLQGDEIDRQTKGCDFNEDHKVNIMDVIAFLLLARLNPLDPRLDRNADGKYDSGDVIQLLIDILHGNCPDATTGLSASDSYFDNR